VVNRLTRKPPTRREQVDAVRLKAAGTPSHINAGEARLLRREMPEAAGPVITHGLLADAGIKGDDRVTNLIPAEKNLLKRHGGSGDRNPNTGLLQFGNSDGEGPSGHDSNPGGVGGGPAGGQTGGGIGGNTEGGLGGLGGGYSGNDSYAGSVNQMLAEELGDYYRDTYVNGMLDDPYAAPDTFYRAWQELRTPSGPAAPGRFGAPNAIGPGIVGTAANMMTGGLLGGLMSLGGAMGRAGGTTTGPDSRNSGGNEGRSSGASDDAAGSSSGASTAKLVKVSQDGYRSAQEADPRVDTSGTAAATGGGSLVAPGGTSIAPDNKSSTLTGLPLPIQSILADYIWRGRQGSGWGW
jgi:hypothetical protein